MEGFPRLRRPAIHRRPLTRLMFSSDRKTLGPLATPRWQLAVGWALAALIVTLNLKLLSDALGGD